VLVGICGGLGEHTPVPAVVWRILFVLAAVTCGIGLLVYVLLWWLMPAADSGGATAGAAWNLQNLRRSTHDRRIEGVCGGLGEYTPVPAWMWRVAFASLIFASGLGLLAYLLLWIFVPSEQALAPGH
jgi:phage shock protein PspC (stress-responsive transcriptional regulator)